MIPRTQNQIAKSKEEALAVFVSSKAEIDTMLTRLRALSDNHFNYSPDEITWGHVAPWSIMPSCSSASRTQPLRRAITPRRRPELPPRLGEPSDGGPNHSYTQERWCSPATEIIP
jgi:hypothetical protein